MPKEMNNIDKTNKIFVLGEDIYFIHSNYIEKYGLNSGELEKVTTPDCKNTILILKIIYSFFINSYP